MVVRMEDRQSCVPAPGGADTWGLTGGGRTSLPDLRRPSPTLPPLITLNDVAGRLPGGAGRVTHG
jgi:hypothetical protein